MNNNEREARRDAEIEAQRDAEREAAIAGIVTTVGLVAAAAGLSYWLSGNTGPQVEVVETRAACDRAVRKLRQSCSNYPVLGLDCEWVHPDRVALIQLSSADYCGLFRMWELNGVTPLLRNLLEDANIRKVGVNIFVDTGKLRKEFNVNVRGALDLRFLAVMTGHDPRGLAALAKSVLNITMDKNEQRSDWEADKLDERQVKYAADDAIIGFKIYKKLTEGISDLSLLSNYIDVVYHQQNHRDLPRIDNTQSECVIQ